MSQYPESTQKLVDKAAEVSGYGFEIVYDQSLPIASSVNMAGRDGREHHEIVLRLPSDENNYLIAWQAAFVIHQYQMPETERATLKPNPLQLIPVKDELLQLHPTIPLNQREAFAEHVLGGVLTQLRSVPIGILIDLELHRNYPELQETQKQSLFNQVVEHIGCLQMTTDMFPKTVLRANQVMNAAQALMVSQLFDEEGIFAPYEAINMRPAAEVLLEVCLHQVFDETKDRDVIDVWGKNLGVDEWYQWA